MPVTRHRCCLFLGKNCSRAAFPAVFENSALSSDSVLLHRVTALFPPSMPRHIQSHGGKHRGVFYLIQFLVTIALVYCFLGASRWDKQVPLGFSSDGLYFNALGKVVVDEGWWFTASHAGYPFTAEYLAFPSSRQCGFRFCAACKLGDVKCAACHGAGLDGNACDGRRHVQTALLAHFGCFPPVGGLRRHAVWPDAFCHLSGRYSIFPLSLPYSFAGHAGPSGLGAGAKPAKAEDTHRFFMPGAC